MQIGEKKERRMLRVQLLDDEPFDPKPTGFFVDIEEDTERDMWDYFLGHENGSWKMPMFGKRIYGKPIDKAYISLSYVAEYIEKNPYLHSVAINVYFTT